MYHLIYSIKETIQLDYLGKLSVADRNTEKNIYTHCLLTFRPSSGLFQNWKVQNSTKSITLVGSLTESKSAMPLYL